jgi:amino acid adenylation domain-containing protein
MATETGALVPSERERSIALGLGPRTPYERDGTIHGVFARQAARAPEAVAVTDGAVALSYAEVERRANRLAHRLIAFGVRPGAGVGVAFERSALLPVALLAILKAGAAYVPLDPAYPRERLALMCADAAVELVLSAGGESHGAFPASVRTLDVLASTDAPETAGAQAPDVVCGPDSLAYVTYTSGSTGKPKAVAVEHRGVLRLVRGADYLEVAPGDAFLQFATLAFDASTFDVWAPLLNGARLAAPRPGLLSMLELAEAIDRFGVTTLFLTTAIFQRLVDTPAARPRALRRLYTGGEVASPAHVARFLDAFPACRLFAVYGPTENTTFSTWCELTRGLPDEPVPIGRAIANSSAYVLDAALEPVAPGEAGELCVGGDGVARGYLNAPQLSAERFVADPFSPEPGARLYRTGDRARYRPDGLLEFLGRSDDQVKIRGFRIEPGEIETTLRAHPAVRETTVVVVEANGEKTLCAFVVPAPNARPDERALRERLALALPAYMVPHRFAFVDELPLGPSGKVDRRALAERANAPARALPPRFGAGRALSTQQRVAAAWNELLGGAEPGLDENFFDAGGDSLSLLSLHQCLQERFATRFAVTELFAHTTVRGQAAFLDRVRA